MYSYKAFQMPADKLKI